MGAPLQVSSLTLTQTEGDYAWVADLILADLAGHQRIRTDDLIVITIDGVPWSFIVDEKASQRSATSAPVPTLSLVSPTASLASPRADTLELSWEDAVDAQTAVEQMLGVSVTWDLVAWTIPGGRLALYDTTPLEAARTVVEAAGGLIETQPDGSILVRHRYPTSPPDWGNATPDHILTDATDNLSCTERYLQRRGATRFTIRDYTPGGGSIPMEVDDREGGLNAGTTSFQGGDTAHILLHVGPTVTLDEVTASTGTLAQGADQSYQVTEDLAFEGSDSVTLSKPATSLDSWTWLGTDLGALTLESDGVTVTAESAGLAVARVVMTLTPRSWAITTPATVADDVDAYPILIQATGTEVDPVGEGEIEVYRGEGATQGEDVVDPLLATLDVMRSRGRAELDAAEALREVEIACICRPELRLGHLVEVHDALMGQSWIGQIVAVTHTIQHLQAVTTVKIMRYADDI
ncbi:MAG: hypothetical protein HQL52_17490 [Magnetococcales bacterium]|nr:hypothetical protein [Magnetococcales bacterium]